MVAGFQDEIDSDDDVSGNPTTPQATVMIKHDIELSSDEEDAMHSHVQVVKYDDDYVTSEDEAPVSGKVLELKPKSYSISSGSEKDVQLTIKPKANSLSSDSDKDITVQNNRQPSPNRESDRDKSGSGDSNLIVNNTSTEMQRKVSSASSRPGNSAISTNENVFSKASSNLTNQNVSSKASSNLTNENSDSESDAAEVQIEVLQDTDVNPEDFGGSDVFNDWLNKQEVNTVNTTCVKQTLSKRPQKLVFKMQWERSGSVGECLTGDRGATG